MKRLLVPLLVLTILALLIPTISHITEESAPPPLAVRLSLTAPPGTELGAGDEPLDATISPSQREVVFVATQLRGGDLPPGTTQLWRRRFDADDAKAIPGTDGARLPAWKQTGNVLSFFSGAQLKLLDLKTGAVSSAADAPAPAGAAWTADGSLLFVPAPGPVRRLAAGRVSEATRLAEGDVAHLFPAAIPESQDFIYTAVRTDGKRVVRLNAGGVDTDIATTAAHALVSHPRWLLVLEGGTLLAGYRDPEGRITGDQFPLIFNVGAAPSGRGLFVASPDVLLHAKASSRPRQVTWLDINGNRLGTVADAGDFWQVRVSPDDQNVAVTARDPLIQSLDVLKIPVDEAQPSLRLTTSITADTDPVWSPEGGRLAFRSMQRGRPEIFVTPAVITSAAAAAKGAMSTANAAGETPTDWRGAEILVQRRGKAGIDLIRVGGQGNDSAGVADSPFNETDGRWSPDGRSVAYVSDEPGQPDIYVQFRDGPRQRVSVGGGTAPRWARNSRALLFLRGTTLMRVEMLRSGERFGAPRAVVDLPGVRDFDLAHRSDRIVALLPVRTSERDAASVVLNWRSLADAQRQALERKTPPKF